MINCFGWLLFALLVFSAPGPRRTGRGVSAGVVTSHYADLFAGDGLIALVEIETHFVECVSLICTCVHLDLFCMVCLS